MTDVLPAALSPPPDSNQTLRELEVGLIPQREFPLRKWYYASPLWYYHAPSIHHQLKRDPKFYELVDPLLRELCVLLAQTGLYTTPSCQGHFYPRERFEQIWDALTRERDAIRHQGLEVKDSETNQPFVFGNPDFELPWQDFTRFYNDAVAHQSQGYIGVAVPPERQALLELLHRSRLATPTVRFAFDEPLSDVLGQPLFGIYVDPASPHERDVAWQAATAFMRSVLAGRLDSPQGDAG